MNSALYQKTLILIASYCKCLIATFPAMDGTTSLGVTYFVAQGP